MYKIFAASILFLQSRAAVCWPQFLKCAGRPPCALLARATLFIWAAVTGHLSLAPDRADNFAPHEDYGGQKAYDNYNKLEIHP